MVYDSFLIRMHSATLFEKPGRKQEGDETLENLITLVKIIAVFIAAIILGNWFTAEAKKSKLKGEPAYKPYFSPPGIIILIAILGLPIAVWILRH